MDDTENQQETVKTEEFAWLAGIIEGEGSITMSVRKKSWNGWNGVGVDCNVQVDNTDSGIILKVKHILNKIGIEPRVSERPTASIKHRDGSEYSSPKTILRIQLSKMSHIKKVLDGIIQHMAGEKKTRAALILEFIQRRQSYQGDRSKGGPSWYTGYDWDLVRRFLEITGSKMLPEVDRILRDYTLPKLEEA